jgi:hypothetical protein
LTGGDKLKRRPPAGVPCQLINHYGPTENTVVSTCIAVPPDETATSAPTIGRPIANTRAYVLDRNRQPVPIGVTGELYLAGEGLARGYLNRPELTAEKFVSNPFAALAPNSDRLYRTGDLVRWTVDGELEYLGRIDNQVKVRGCRIELGEIEAALHALPAVRESLVVTRPDGRGESQLVGYVLARATTTEEEILSALREKLPAYMVPASVMLLDAWPLTPNGKIDRRVLPAPRATRTASEAVTTPMEATVARIFSEVLGRPVQGREENFFALGGHSLLAAQVVSRLNAAVSASLSVRTVFDQPTVADLAREMERRLEAPATTRVLPRVKRRVSPELELVQPN